MIPERYKKMQDKFDLPQFCQLKETFKIDVEDSEEVFDNIRNEVSERLFTFTERVLEPIIGGSDSFSCIFEQHMITEKERDGLFELYKKIQVLKWENNSLMLNPDEKRAAEWIKKAWDLWNNELEKEFSKICKKFSMAWLDLRFKNENAYYHG